ncbi:MAG: hypothetical protein ACKVVP_15530 [Chloroflexota bacterium]
MVRKQLYLEQDQDRLLKRRASELGISEAEAVRILINQSLVQPRCTRGSDGDAWERERAFIEARRMIRAPQVDRTWQREDLYDRSDHDSID